MIDTLFSYGANARYDLGDTECTKMVAGSKDTLGFDQMSQTMMLQYTLDPVVQTVPLSAVSIINASGTSHQYSTESKQGDMDVSTAQTQWNCIQLQHMQRIAEEMARRA